MAMYPMMGDAMKRLLPWDEVEEVADHVTMINGGRIVLSAPLDEPAGGIGNADGV